MPCRFLLAHKLTMRLWRCANGKLALLRPDGKSQVTVEYDENLSRCGWTLLLSRHNMPRPSAMMSLCWIF